MRVPLIPGCASVAGRRTLMSARVLSWSITNDAPLVELRQSLGQVCMYARLRVCVFLCARICVCAHAFVCTLISLCAHIYLCKFCACARIYLCAYVLVCAHLCVCACLRVCLCVFV